MPGCLSVFGRPFRPGKGKSSEGCTFRSNSQQGNASFYYCACDAGPSPPAYVETDCKAVSEDALKAASSISHIADTIEAAIDDLSADLRKLSLEMWNHPEIAWKEHHTHDLFTEWLGKQDGWNVTPHAYGLQTAFKAEFVHASEGVQAKDVPVLGFQSELDALPGIGHACGHNLIAISGIAASLGLAKALIKYDISARIILIGTPAEEAAGGKLELLKRGAYKEMDACLMVHPAPLASAGKMLAVQQIKVTYTGRTAHAGAAPWEGVNAQDAGVLAYVNISALRQQIPPDQRVHGIIQGEDWAANVIPGKCILHFNTRASTAKACNALTSRVRNCFEAAAQATGCKCDVDVYGAYDDVANVSTFSESFRAFAKDRFDEAIGIDTFYASTDFGNITHIMPALHAEYAIPLKNFDTDKNHTIGFANASKTPEAHAATLRAALNISVIAARFAKDIEFRTETQKKWREWKRNADKE